MGGFPSSGSSYPQPGTSPKQQMNIPQFSGSSSPSSSSNTNSRQSSTSSSCQNRTKQSQVVNVGSLKKRTAPAPPPTNSLQTMYSTLPHAPRHSQSIDSSDTMKSNNDMYSTLPHSRTSSDTKNSSFHFDNKMYERFEPLINSSQQAKYDKHRFDSGENLVTTLSTFSSAQTHKRSPSGDSIGRNLHLAGAKLVLPSGEIPILKPVDKNYPRPRLPPPGPPSNNGHGNIFTINIYN